LRNTRSDTGGVNGRNAGELPIQSDRANERCTNKLVIADIVDFKPASPAVAQQSPFRQGRR
jgi:hypothetical protein